ncbi:hypothetical protein [Agrilutibacter solisilvae]|uniref:Porin n=1 Tax=Agrilutibacter solisilvae TaxID=2763317 RepID=A0A975ARH0_9GAMM|nr:hypothetical protein [Lysobacter solisilvae]QSX76945.1 hypothetical protein I8J32_008920 [Lysobacter solisilvae]
MRKSLLALAVLAVLPLASAQAADPATDRRIELLEAQVQALQAELRALQAASKGTPPAESVASQSAQVDSTAATAEEIDDLAATPEAADATAAVAAADGSQGASSANAFNPAITLILNGSYSHHSLDPDAYVRAGFPLVGEGGPAPDGFSLGESELALSANIDDKFYGQLTLAVESEDGQDEVAIEEAYIDTTALPAGFSLRLGRFFSNIGYLNGHHAHTDSFFDRPLAYQAFLGGQYGDDGAQLRWVAPTDLLFELGGEIMRGEPYPGGGAQRGGLGTRTLFAHLGGDAGHESAWLAGVSMLDTRAEGGEDGFNGDARVFLADATWKWAPQGNFKDGGVTVRGEYFIDDRDGVYIDPEDPAVALDWDGRRRGAYVETVYRINRLWDVGYRYDRLWADNGGPYASTFDPDRHSAELTWRNSEFSLFRLQVSHDRPNADDSDTAVTVQYQASLGAHGAHKF